MIDCVIVTALEILSLPAGVQAAIDGEDAKAICTTSELSMKFHMSSLEVTSPVK